MPGQPRRRGRLRLSRRRQHADPPGADRGRRASCAPSCRGTSRAAASRPRATPAAPARSASASPPAGPAPPTSSPAWPTPRWTRCPLVAITGQVGTAVIGTDAFQETPIVEVCRAITKHHYLVHADRGHCRASSRRRSTSPAPAGPARSSSTCPRTSRTSKIVPNYDPPMNLPGYRPFRKRHAQGAGGRAGGDPPSQQADHLRRRRHHRTPRRPRI